MCNTSMFVTTTYMLDITMADKGLNYTLCLGGEVLANRMESNVAAHDKEVSQ